jgi:hypothetical protein
MIFVVDALYLGCKLLLGELGTTVADDDIASGA